MMLSRFVYSLPLVVFTLIFSNTVRVEKELEHYFSGLVDQFDSISGSPILKQKELNPANDYFTDLLQSHSHIHSLARVSSKGLQVNYIEQGQPISYTTKEIGQEAWYQEVSEKKEPYYGMEKIAGQTFLLWVNPLFVTRPDESIRFGGAVVLKLNLEEQIHQFAKNEKTPFSMSYGQQQLVFNGANEEGFAVREAEIPGYGIVKLGYSLSEIAPLATTVEESIGAEGAPSPIISSFFAIKQALSSPLTPMRRSPLTMVVSLIGMALVICGLGLLIAKFPKGQVGI